MKRIVIFILVLSLALFVACSSDKTQQSSSLEKTETEMLERATETEPQTSSAETTVTQETSHEETATYKSEIVTAATAAFPETETITVTTQPVTASETSQSVSQTQLNPEPENCFDLKIYTDKAAYTTSEAITCWATIEYIGNNDSIIIDCNSDFVIFSVMDGEKFNPDILVNLVGVQGIIKKGQVIRKDNSFIGKWSIDSEGQSSCENQKELMLPAGDYTITAEFEYSFIENDIQINRIQKSEAKITVED